MSETNDQTGKLLSLEVLLRQATERNGNLCVQLAAMTAERDALRLEVEQLRREGRVLAGEHAKDGNCPQGEWECRETEYPGDIANCRECWSEWAKQQAAMAGKEGEE